MAYDPKLPFLHHDDLAEFAVSKQSYLAARPDAPFGYIAASALAMDLTRGASPRVLLLQRAATDSDPHRWEPAGGACDDADPTILHGAARELWEETGLAAALFVAQAGEPHRYTLGDGKSVCQFNFVALPGRERTVTLDPEEHQRFVWATREEVEARRVEAEGVDLEFTRDEVWQTVLAAFDWLSAQPLPIQAGGEKATMGRLVM